VTDVVIRAGTLVTPSGPQLADLAITDGVIREISAGATAGREEIDATGLLVMPGVLDVHLLVSRLRATIRRGVTIFNDGLITAKKGGRLIRPA